MTKPVAEIWYGVDPSRPGVLRLCEAHVDPYLAGDIWLIRGAARDLVVDSGTGIVPPEPVIAALSAKPLLAVALCHYFDHAGGMYSFEDRACHPLEAEPLATGADDASRYVSDEMLTALPCAGYRIADYRMRPAPPTRLLNDGDSIDLGDRRLVVLHIPGRTPGSLALWEEATGYLFVGETLFDDPLDRDFPPEHAADFATSLTRLARLPVSTAFAGHYGAMSPDRMRALVDREIRRYAA